MKYLTDEELQQDLNKLYERLADSRYKLSELPSSVDSWKEQKKLDKKKKILRDEIKHIRKLIAIGQGALYGTG